MWYGEDAGATPGLPPARLPPQRHQLSCQGSSGLCIFPEGCVIRGGFHSEVWLVWIDSKSQHRAASPTLPILSGRYD